MKKFILFTLVYCSPLLWRGAGGEVNAQDQNLIDSLQRQLKIHNAHKVQLGKNAPALYDSTKANILYELCKSYINNDPSKSIEFANQSLKFAHQIGFKKGEGNAYFIFGKINNQKGDFAQALDFYNKSLEIRTAINDKIGMAYCRNGFGSVYFSLGSYPLALQHHLIALKIREEIDDKNGIAGSYNNIGMVYMMQKSYDNALKYFFNALEISKVTGNKQYHSANIENIGIVYNYQGNYEKAILQFEASIKILKEIDNDFYLSGAYINIAEAYINQGNYPKALLNIFASLKISKELNDVEGLAISNLSIGIVYMKQKKYKEASEFLEKGLVYAKEIGGLETMKNCYEAMANIDSAQGNFKETLVHYKQFIAIRDSIYNQENTNKTTALQLQYDTEKKEQQITLLTKESKLQQTELQKQNTTRNALIAACALIALLAGIIYNRYRIKQKANAEIESTLQHLKNTQEQLVEHEKLASLGKFTSDVAREIEVPVKHINQLTNLNKTLIQNIKSKNSALDVESLKSNLIHIYNHGKDADAVVKKVLTETRKVQG